MTGAAVELRGVRVRYGSTVALDGVDLTVPHRDFLALIGPNGGGKTTLLRVLLGLVEPEAGSVQVLGVPPRRARGRVGYVPQAARFDRAFPARVAEVVVMGRLRSARSWPIRLQAADREASLDALGRAGVRHLADRPIRTLSGGELQRVLIARALAIDPELLLLDEPTASLDLQSAAAFYALLDTLSKDRTVILSTHDLTAVSRHVRTIACLNRTLFWHGGEAPTAEALAEAYGCPLDLIAHGAPHRVLEEHAPRTGEENP